jgi:hypothetical protein
VVGEPGDSLDVSRLAFAELNLWVDQATNVVTRLTLQANGEEEGGAGRFEVLFDYYDFNADDRADVAGQWLYDDHQS